MPSDNSNARNPMLAPSSIAVTIWNRKILISILWLLLSCLVTSLVLRMPRFYTAEATVLVQAEGIPEKYVPQSIDFKLQEQLESLKQRILSRSALNKIMKDFKLYEKEQKFLNQEQIIEKFRDDISMKLERGWSSERPGTFKIAYIGRDPIVVAQVANRIARFFIEENIRDRQTQANATSEFLAHELEQARGVLATQDARIQQYKLKFNGELPQQDGELVASVGQLKAQLTSVQESLNRAVQNKIFLESSLQAARAADALRKHLIEQERAAEIRLESERKPPEEQPTVPETERLRKELAELRQQYGEQHPEIQRLMAAYRRAEAAERSAPAAKTSSHAPIKNESSSKNENPSARQEVAKIATPFSAGQSEAASALGAQLVAVNKEIADLENERQSLAQDFKALQSKMNRIPLHEQQLATITRDHEIAKANYQSLLERKLSADVAANMETRRKAERFTLLDEARVPEEPVKPKRMFLIAGGSLGSLLLALAAALGLEWRRNVILGEWELPTGVTVLGRVPHLVLRNKEEKMA